MRSTSSHLGTGDEGAREGHGGALGIRVMITAVEKTANSSNVRPRPAVSVNVMGETSR